MPYKELEICSTGELVAKALELGQDCENRPLWYRGHTSSAHTLAPSLLRKLDSADEIFKSERRLLTRFRQRSMPYWPAGYPQNDWEHLFAMQHYGIPTRLLDWSENLFIGLYFAALNAPAESDPTLWILDPIRWNQSAKQLQDFSDVGILTTDSEELTPYAAVNRDGQDLVRRYLTPLAIYGTHNSPRIVAQRGAFTVAGNSLNPLESFGPEDETVIWKVSLNYGREQMVNDLATLGFAESMVFPDLVGLSKEITFSEGLS